MPTLQRSVSIRGARFFRDGETVMFVHHVDASTRDGPRPATDEDRAAHSEAWAQSGEDAQTIPRKTKG